MDNAAVAMQFDLRDTWKSSKSYFDFFSLPVNNFLKDETLIERDFLQETSPEQPKSTRVGLLVSLHEAVAMAGIGEENY